MVVVDTGSVDTGHSGSATEVGGITYAGGGGNGGNGGGYIYDGQGRYQTARALPGGSGGSCGPAFNSSGPSPGGGVLSIQASESIRVDGSIIADGTSTYNNGGGAGIFPVHPSFSPSQEFHLQVGQYNSPLLLFLELELSPLMEATEFLVVAIVAAELGGGLYLR